MIKLAYRWTFALTALIVFWGCQEDEELTVPEPAVEEVQPDSALLLKDTTYQIMKEWYLWNEELPEVNPDNYESAEALLNALLNPLDKWSYIQEEETYDQFFNSGQYEGYGFRMAFDEEDKLRVAFAYRDSPFGKLGVDRSWTINRINGKTIPAVLAEHNNRINPEIANSTNTFELIDDKGNTITQTLSKETIGINTVLHQQVFDLNGTKVGYLVFNSFLDTSIDELKPVFREFRDQGISELVLDLRYNGGGRVNVAEYMAANIVGNRGVGRNFIEYMFNEQQSEQNQFIQFVAPEYPLNLDRLITITSKSTASASELVINGLRPFMDVVVIGDNTHGKPVGSFPFKFGGYAISPISFKIANDDGEGEYFEGFEPNSYIADDLGHKFGDPMEARLAEALNFIETGMFLGETARQEQPEADRRIEWSGFRQEIGAY